MKQVLLLLTLLLFTNGLSAQRVTREEMNALKEEDERLKNEFRSLNDTINQRLKEQEMLFTKKLEDVESIRKDLDTKISINWFAGVASALTGIGLLLGIFNHLFVNKKIKTVSTKVDDFEKRNEQKLEKLKGKLEQEEKEFNQERTALRSSLEKLEDRQENRIKESYEIHQNKIKEINDHYAQKIEKLERDHEQSLHKLEARHTQEMENFLEQKGIDIKAIFKSESSYREARSNVSVLVISPANEVNKPSITEIKKLVDGQIGTCNFKFYDELDIKKHDYDIYLLNNATGSFDLDELKKTIIARNQYKRTTTFFYYNVTGIPLRFETGELTNKIDQSFAGTKVTLYPNLMNTLLYHWLLKKKPHAQSTPPKTP